jgi:nitric oxide reductase activation protein
MQGARRKSAMESAVILHEVLKKQKIQHAIVEHRAAFDRPKVDINILLDFSARDEQKYNLMLLDAANNTRDALALFWAERYISQKTFCEHKLIIVLSDGEPCHDYDNYVPPMSVKDTAGAVKKISARGTDIIAVALDNTDEYDTYEDLREIYPSLVACSDLFRLTGQLLKIISRKLTI